jgi:competence protein ComFB
MNDIDVELRLGNTRSEMIDPNWQNPYRLVPNTAGTFTFWPKPIAAEGLGVQKSFDFGIIIAAPKFEVLQHFFQISRVSENQVADSFSMQRTYKIPDLYLFPPGDEEDQ